MIIRNYRLHNLYIILKGICQAPPWGLDGDEFEGVCDAEDCAGDEGWDGGDDNIAIFLNTVLFMAVPHCYLVALLTSVS